MTVRKSNIELMRIVLFFMVVVIHSVGSYLANYHYIGTLNWQFSNFLDGMSHVAVVCFVLISGYFMCNNQINTKKYLLRFLLLLGLYLLPYMLFYLRDTQSLYAFATSFLKDFLRCENYFFHLWYIQVIMVVYLLSNYLNKLIEVMTKDEYRKLLIILIGIFSIMPTICYFLQYPLFNRQLFFARICLFTTLYFIGGYIRNHVNITWSARRLFIAFLGFNVLVVFMTALYNYKLSPVYLFQKFKGADVSYPFANFVDVMYEYDNIIVIIPAVLLLMFFLKLDITSSKINYLSKKTFGAYIIHVFWIRSIQAFVLNPHAYSDTVAYPLYMTSFIVIVFLTSIISVIVMDFVIDKLGVMKRFDKLKL